MKRLFAFALTLTLVLSLSVTAFAADPGSITVSNATVGETYTLYKIFDAKINDDGSGITYSVTPGTALAKEMFGDDGKTDNTYFTYDATTGTVALKSGVDEAELFDYLETLENKQKVDEVEAGSTTVDFTGLDYGYYLIESTMGALVTVDSTKPHADVIDKNSTSNSFDKQVKHDDSEEWDEDDSISANIGDIVNFKVGFTGLNYKNKVVNEETVAEKVVKYTIKDTLDPTDWAAIDTSSIKVTVNGTELADDAYEIEADTNGFEITIPWVDDDGEFLYDSSVPVEITYSATVLEDAAEEDGSAVNKNNAELIWNDETEGEDDDTETTVYNMGFIKIDGATGAALAGAEFALYSDSGCTLPVALSGGTDGVYKVAATGNNVVVTPADGQVVIMGLKEGTYYLKETTAPDGYNLMAEVQEVVVGAINDEATNVTEIKIGETDYTANNAKTEIKNNKGMELPSTGGKGTMMLITIGTMVAMGFAVLLITHKKMSIYHD